MQCSPKVCLNFWLVLYIINLFILPFVRHEMEIQASKRSASLLQLNLFPLSLCDSLTNVRLYLQPYLLKTLDRLWSPWQMCCSATWGGKEEVISLPRLFAIAVTWHEAPGLVPSTLFNRMCSREVVERLEGAGGGGGRGGGLWFTDSEPGKDLGSQPSYLPTGPTGRRVDAKRILTPKVTRRHPLPLVPSPHLVTVSVLLTTFPSKHWTLVHSDSFRLDEDYPRLRQLVVAGLSRLQEGKPGFHSLQQCWEL